MTNPGPLDRLPTKVVPYVVTGYAEEEQEPVDPEQPAESAAEASRTKTAWVGIVALGLSVCAAVLHVIAVVVASGNDFEPATLLGYGAIGVSALGVIVGIVAVIMGRGRRWGVAAIVLGLIANPLLLLVVLRFASGLVTG